MFQIAYARHFAVLAGLSVFTALCVRHGAMPGGVRAFALYGALHAASLVTSLRKPVVWWKRLSLVALAAALSMMSFGAGLLVKSAASLVPGRGATYLALGCAAALGAASYALALCRVLDLRLRGGAVAWIAAGCVLATYLAVFTSPSVGLGLWWPVVLWWFAFSGALWLAEPTHRSLKSSAAH
jgi:hypothetical protein